MASPAQARDPGVIGMGAFLNETRSLQPANSSYGASNLYEKDYAQEWGKLSEEEKGERLTEMSRLRAETDKLVKKANAGRPVAAALFALAALLIQAKRNGFQFPSFLTLGNLLKAATAGFLAFLYSIRAPDMVNPPVKGAPTHFPIIGMAPGTIPGAIRCANLMFHDINKRVGFKTWEITAMDGQSGVVVMDPVDRRYVLKDNWKNYLKNVDVPGSLSFQDLFCEIMGRGVFSTDKREWQDHRKVASTMFSVNGLRTQMEHVFRNHTKKLIKLLVPLVDSGKTVDLQNIFQCFTFDTICEIAFGISFNALDVGVRGEREPFLVAFDTVQTCSGLRAFEPRSWWELKKWLGFGSEKKIFDSMKVVNGAISNVIRERRHSGDFATKDDLLSLYIQFARKSGQSYMEEDAYLRDVILNFMIAGRDTTSCTLTNLFKLLGTAKDGSAITKQLVEELRKEVGDASSLDWESVKKLTFGDAVFNETLRMYPPVSGDFRMAEQDDVLPSSGFKIKKGMRAMISNLSIGRDPNLFSDPDTFKPNRWVQLDEKGEMMPIRRPDEYVFPVFWAGARLCLGKDMARFEVKLVALSLLEHFRFEVLEHEELYVNGPVIFYVGGLPVKIRSA